MTYVRFRLFALATFAMAVAALPAQDQLVKQALKKIESVEKRLPQLADGDVPAANRLLNDLRWADKRLKAAYKKNTTFWKDASARSSAADKAIRKKAAASAGGGGTGGKPANNAVIGKQFEKLQQLNKEVNNGFKNLQMLNKSFMGDAYRVGSTHKEIDGLKRRLAEFPADDKNVKVVAGNLQKFEALFAKWQREYAADSDAAAGLGAKLDAIKAKYAKDAVPGPVYWPYEREQLTLWAARSKQLLDGLPADVAVMQTARKNVKLKKRANNMLHWIGRSVARQLQEQTDGVQMICNNAVKDSLATAKALREIQLDDKHMIVNRVLREGALEENMARLQKGREAIDLAAMLDRELAVEGAPDRTAQRKQIDATIERLRELAKAALADVRMPRAAKLEDALQQELAEFARTTLARKKYGTHKIERLIVTSDKQRKEKTEGTIRGNVVGATITSYHYVWDEYRVVTAEHVDGELWVFHNLLKFYHSSDSVTPQGKWILSRRFKGTQILAENVDK